MAGNKSLTKAKKAKEDEFYTQLSDIEEELKHYKHHFKGKTVLCNCDDPYESKFFKYFALNFNYLGLKELITTCYNGSPISGDEITLQFEEFENKPTKPAYALRITEVKDFNGDGAVDLSDVEYLLKNDKNVKSILKTGAFKSKECVELLKQADIVVTNPPFSLFREYVAQLMQFGKQFIIIGNKNAITYKEIFPLIKANKIWIGVTPMSKDMFFRVPNAYQKYLLETKKKGSGYVIDKDGEVKARAQAIWFTNLDIPKRHENLPLYKHYTPEEYPKYDNYDAINVDKTADIPMDYDGVMGVPITFLDKYNPDQFEIVEFRKGVDGKDLVYSDLANGGAEVSILQNTCPSMPIGGLMNNPKDTMVAGKSKYARILIRRLLYPD